MNNRNFKRNANRKLRGFIGKTFSGVNRPLVKGFGGMLRGMQTSMQNVQRDLRKIPSAPRSKR